MEPSRSGDPHDNLIPWQKIKGKEWSHQEIGHAGPPSQRRVGRDAVGYYHERKNENRNVGVGPEHEWSSHHAHNLRGRPSAGTACANRACFLRRLGDGATGLVIDDHRRVEPANLRL